MYLFFFFFKQKTAYEMRISDWSSDVCSSDLTARAPDGRHRSEQRQGQGHRRPDGAGAQGGRPAEGAVARKPPADPLHPGRGREVGVRVGGASQHAAGRGVAADRPAALRQPGADAPRRARSEEDTYELQSLMRT